MQSDYIFDIFENLRDQKVQDAAERCEAGIENARRWLHTGSQLAEINSYLFSRRVMD